MVSGVSMRIIGVGGMSSYFLIGFGVLSKLSYLLKMLINKEYKPGYELLVLYSGLAIFFSGIFIKNQDVWDYAFLLIYCGIIFKITFVFLFVRKLRKNVIIKR